MPYCKNCKTRLSKFDSDICPVCGTKNPFDIEYDQTIDNTGIIGSQAFKYKFKSKKICLLLSLLCGFTGAMYFYIKKNKFAAIWLIANLLVVTGFSLLLMFVAGLDIAGLFISLGVIYLINIIVGLIFFFTPNQKDGNGEYIQ